MNATNLSILNLKCMDFWMVCEHKPNCQSVPERSVPVQWAFCEGDDPLFSVIPKGPIEPKGQEPEALGNQ